jgi:uncharacterized protein YfbU (UPF0304 family)
MTLSDGEKLILHMLCDLFESQEVESDIDPAFVRDALHSNHLWALEDTYAGVFGGEPTPEPLVSEVVNHLLMWDWLETAWAKYDANTRQALKDEGFIWRTGDQLFPGFDGNNESSHLSAARFMIDKMGRFSIFAGRDLNSHHPVIDAYRRMYPVFNAMWLGRDGRQTLSPDEFRKIMAEYTHPERRKAS